MGLNLIQMVFYSESYLSYFELSWFKIVIDYSKNYLCLRKKRQNYSIRPQTQLPGLDADSDYSIISEV